MGRMGCDIVVGVGEYLQESKETVKDRLDGRLAKLDQRGASDV